MARGTGTAGAAGGGVLDSRLLASAEELRLTMKVLVLTSLDRLGVLAGDFRDFPYGRYGCAGVPGGLLFSVLGG